MKIVAANLALLCFSCTASAHDLWLNADPLRPPQGARITLELRLGEAGVVETLPFQAPRTERLFVSSPHGRSDLPVADGKPLVLPAGTEATYAFGYIGRPSMNALPPDEFDAYLREEGLSQVLAARRDGAETSKPIREQYSRSLKALVAVGDAPLADCPLGLPLELILVQADATSLVAQARFRGEPLPGLWVDRGDARGRTLVAQRTDAQGMVRFPAESAHWILRATHMEASGDAAADWRSWWATTAFGWNGEPIAACPATGEQKAAAGG